VRKLKWRSGTGSGGVFIAELIFGAWSSHGKQCGLELPRQLIKGPDFIARILKDRSQKILI
jgi:hypothetical protein